MKTNQNIDNIINILKEGFVVDPTFKGKNHIKFIHSEKSKLGRLKDFNSLFLSLKTYHISFSFDDTLERSSVFNQRAFELYFVEL